jgi:hypothetical protein
MELSKLKRSERVARQQRSRSCSGWRQDLRTGAAQRQAMLA